MANVVSSANQAEDTENIDSWGTHFLHHFSMLLLLSASYRDYWHNTGQIHDRALHGFYDGGEKISVDRSPFEKISTRAAQHELHCVPFLLSISNLPTCGDITLL